MTCYKIHAHDDPRVGQPFRLDCYDHEHQVVWNHFVPRLWDRTMTAIRRAIGHRNTVKLRYAKVGEYQRRGVIHLHALIRLDGVDPKDPHAIVPPPEWATADHLAEAITDAAAATTLRTQPHPDRPEGWLLAWGDGGTSRHADVRIIRRGIPGVEITEQHVAGYIAKYVTKGAETAGLNTSRLSEATAQALADPYKRRSAHRRLLDDIDLTANVLRVRRSLHRVHGHLSVFPTKTQLSTRAVPLPTFVARVLKEWRAKQEGERAELGKNWPDLGYVFATPIGTPIDPRNCTRVIRRQLDAAGLTHVRLHDLRHGCVTLLLSMGVPPRVVMEIVGHSTLEMTMNVYAHVSLDDKRTALDGLADYLDAVTE